tara:strand:- start:32 stop:538 length:507 start_codon:yes stop_codon:yes gene_type:complete
MSILKVDTINEKTSGNGVVIPSHVVQTIVGNRITGNFATTSASYSDVVSLSITPKESNSLIKVSFYYQHGGNHSMRLYRDSTIIMQPTNGWFVYEGYSYANQSAWNNGSSRDVKALFYVDSPSTTSATTYKWQIAAYPAANSSGVGLNELNATSSSAYSYMELQEIAQ